MVTGLVIVGLGVTIFMMNKKNSAMKLEYEQKIADLQSQLTDYGDAKEVFYTEEEIPPGKPIDKTKLKTRTIPSSWYSQEYISDETVFDTTLAKVKIGADSPILKSMLTPEVVYDGDRLYDVVADNFPVHLKVNDFIDYQLVTPQGVPYTVFSKARVVALEENSITVKMSHEDNSAYHSALVDHYLNPGTWLTAGVYVEPGVQNATLAYYPVSKLVLDAMSNNPNIVAIAKKELIEKRRISYENSLKITEDLQKPIVDGRTILISKLLTDMQTFRAQVASEQGEEKPAAAEGEEAAEDSEKDTAPEGGVGN